MQVVLILLLLAAVFFIMKQKPIKGDRKYPVYLDSQEEYLNQPVKYGEWMSSSCGCKLV